MENNELMTKELESQIEEIQNEQSDNIRNSKKKKKGLIAIIALILAGVTALTVLLWPKKQDNNKGKLPQKPLTSTIIPDEDVSIDEIGTKFDDPTIDEEKTEYGEVTGDVDKEEIVEKDETIWKDQEAADKSEQVGKEEIDDKDGTLEVKPNGDVFVKDEDYEIEKEDGTVVEGTITEEDKENGEIGSNGTILPPGYVYDENLDKDVVEEDANKFVYSDADYYDYTGELIYSKGELISKEDLERAKQLLTTTKPVTEPEATEPEVTEPEVTEPEATEPEVTEPEVTEPEATEPEVTTPQVDEGVINPNGTYTIYGVTYMSKEDYHQFLLYPEQYGYYNGMVLSLEDIEAMFKESQKSK